MVREIRIYIEGGGDGKETKASIRAGFSEFLKDIVKIAQNKRIRWNIIICGSRNDAFSDFKNALESHSDAFNVLLVDSEAPVKKSPWEHLKLRDNWDTPGVDDRHCHLMVQTMEAWFIADIDTLKKYYGQGFRENSVPRNPNVEEIDKDSLVRKLKEATQNTKSKGEYQKIGHASALLKQLNTTKVRKASQYCDRLFITLAQIMGETI